MADDIIKFSESNSTVTDKITMNFGGMTCGIEKNYRNGQLKKARIMVDRVGYNVFVESSGNQLAIDPEDIDAVIALLQAAKKEVQD